MFEELTVLKEKFMCEQEAHENRSNHTKARNYVAKQIQDMCDDSEFEITPLELRIAATVAMHISENGIVLTSLLGQIRHLEDDLDVISEAILRLKKEGLVTIRHTRPLAEEHNNVVLEFSEDIEWDNESVEIVEAYTEFGYPLPSLRPARIRTKNTDSGMHFSHTSVMAGHELNMHDGDLNLGHLNKLGQIQFELNMELMNQFDEYEMMSEKSREAALLYHDSPEEFIEESGRVYDVMNGKRFSFDWFRDSRGRKYPRGYHLSPHGTEFKKHSLVFAKKLIIALD